MVYVGGLDVPLLAGIAGLPLLGAIAVCGGVGVHVGGLDVVTLLGAVAGCHCWAAIAGCHCWAPLLGIGGGGCTRCIAGCHCWAAIAGDRCTR